MRAVRVFLAAYLFAAAAALAGCQFTYAPGAAGPHLPFLGPKVQTEALPPAVNQQGVTIDGGHAHIMCHGGYIWVQNMTDAERPMGTPFQPEIRTQCQVGEVLMNPRGAEHVTQYESAEFQKLLRGYK